MCQPVEDSQENVLMSFMELHKGPFDNYDTIMNIMELHKGPFDKLRYHYQYRGIAQRAFLINYDTIMNTFIATGIKLIINPVPLPPPTPLTIAFTPFLTFFLYICHFICKYIFYNYFQCISWGMHLFF